MLERKISKFAVMAFAARFSELDEIAALIKQGNMSPEPSMLKFLNRDMINIYYI